MERNCIYTIGHSNLSQNEFIRRLLAYNINCVVDVRSIPASKYSPQFNREVLDSFLKQHHIRYEFFGYEFGARRMDSINDEGLVDFEMVIQTPLFQNGIKRFQLLPQDCISVIMCSEVHPLECHRFSLVARYFHEHGYEVHHIIKEEEYVTHEKLEKEMINKYLQSKKHQLSEIDELFGSYTAKDQLRDAYKLKNKEIGYRITQQDNNLE
jgi:uncharacterized protein (DUF488 family)